MEIQYGNLEQGDVLAALRERSMTAGVDFCSLVPHLRLTRILTTVELSFLNLGAIGLANRVGVTLEQVLQVAAEKGFTAASVEMMLALRLDYTSQPPDNWLTSVDRVSICGNARSVQVHVGHPADGPWINCCYVGLTGVVAQNSRFVFYRE